MERFNSNHAIIMLISISHSPSATVGSKCSTKGVYYCEGLFFTRGTPMGEVTNFFHPRIERYPTPPKDLIILSSDDDDDEDNTVGYPIMKVIQIEGDEEGEGSTKSNDVNQRNVPIVHLDPTDENSTNVRSPQYKFGPWCPSGVTPTKPPNVAKLVKPKKEPLDEPSTTSKIMRKLKFP
ncbi:hypothetical protein BUALT_Bualt08G0051100 [Buddleja alternifolia]|uniref:Uncharacterized protein n=1 Tax=Buddleja alternifolia TaxID=168488 RepID=A0AAV6XCB4_9LAMI|nr:hypothetical protein BUALT_Bualt08G0051100 [Buddleja alternifolia]